MRNSQMENRVAHGIRNGNVSRIIKWNDGRCRQVARETLKATEYKSLAAARRHLDGQRINYSF
jgi:hypothetical protein